MELPQEAVGQFASAVEEVPLQRGQGPEMQRPQQPLLAEERVVGKQAGQGAALGHHVGVDKSFFARRNVCVKGKPAGVVCRRRLLADSLFQT